MRELQAKHDIVGDVRGQGLMLGLEMVTDRASKAPATAETLQASRFPLRQRARDHPVALLAPRYVQGCNTPGRVTTSRKPYVGDWGEVPGIPFL